LRVTVLAPMLNEPPSNPEWVSRSRMLGLIDIVVVATTCTDHFCLAEGDARGRAHLAQAEILAW